MAHMYIMMTTTQRKMPHVRRKIAKIFTEYEEYVNCALGKITRQVQEIFEGVETSKLTKSYVKATEKLEEKIKEMKEIKKDLKDCLETLKQKKWFPPDLQSQGSASKGKGKGKVNWEYQLKHKNPEMDMKLEKILEEASIKSKEEEFKLLDKQLQMCLLCFSIFPMNAEIVKRVLIYWWIGEGFVTAKADQTAEEVGEDCFNKLVVLEFIQPVYNRRRENILRCKMHPWIRWMIIRLSRNEDFFNLDESGMPSSSPSKSRHACLMSKNEAGLLEEEYCPNPKEPSLLSLHNVNVRYLKLNFSIEALPKLKTLVVLQLGGWRGSSNDRIDVEESKSKDVVNHHIEIQGTQLLERLDVLVHLRYLSLRGISRITELPSSIKALQNLEILDLRGCQNLEKLTDEIKWLHRLTHLDVSDCYMLEWMPKGLRSLSELQVLKGFVFGGHRSRDPCKLADLQILKKLRKLSISIGKQVNADNVDLHELYKIGLRSVAITWSASAFMKISFPPSIVKLDLRCFPESDPSPSFNSMHLVNLEKLYIRGGKMAKLHFGETSWKIKMLRLKFLKEMKLENIDIEALFPQLEYLEVYECENIKLSDESYQLDSDGVWVKEALDGSTTVTAASAAATTTPEASPASTAPTATSEAPPAPAASPTTPEAPPASAAPTTTIQEAPLASATPTTNPEAPPASISPATTPEASSASAAPTTTPKAAPATTAPTTTQEAAPASATPTTTSEAAPASAAPTTTPEAPPAFAIPTSIPEASPTSAAPTTITKDPSASPTPTTTQEASPASTPPTSTAEASSTSTATTTTASAAPATTPEASAASAALATTPEAFPASAAPTTTQAIPASAAPTTT